LIGFDKNTGCNDLNDGCDVGSAIGCEVGCLDGLLDG
jgi:hypothetical protein